MGQDLFRDTPVRYLGYANEIGEAFRALIPTKAVWATYGVTCAYGICDTFNKGLDVYREVPAEEKDKRRRLTVLTTFDALVWQAMASVIIPGFNINRLSWATRLGLTSGLKVPKLLSKYISVGVGLAAIPIIVKPIDRAVDRVMNRLFRPWLFKTEEKK